MTSERADQNLQREFEYRREDFEAIRKRLYASSGINLSDSKQQLVYSRIARRLRAVGVRTFSDYLNYLNKNKAEEEEFVNALTTNLTSFFREPHHFEILAEFLKEKSRDGRLIRLWCAAASTGEEPYSMAMVALETLGPNPPVKIMATDIDSQVLRHADIGIYDLERISTLSQARLKAFFLKGVGAQQGRVKVRREVRQLVDYAPLNLLSPVWKLSAPYDLIFCRNVMIYFDKKTQKSILDRMIPLLSRDGLYIAGHSESFTHASKLIRLVGKTTYRVVDGAA